MTSESHVSTTGSFPDVTFRIARTQHIPDILDFVHNNFLPDEPVFKALLGTADPESHEVAEWKRALEENFINKSLTDSMTIVALDSSTNQLLGLSINAEENRPEPGEAEKEVKRTEVEGSVYHLLKVVNLVKERGGDLFEEYDADALFHIQILVVGKMNRKAGLATELIKRSVDLSRILGFKAITAEATGIYSCKAFMKNGFKKKAEYVYSNYRENNMKIFHAMEPQHKCMTLVVKENVRKDST